MDGGIAIEGQDLGDLSRFFGAGVREYEWATSVTADELPKLRTALDGSATADIEDLVKDRFSGVRHGEFRQFCEDHNISPTSGLDSANKRLPGKRFD